MSHEYATYRVATEADNHLPAFDYTKLTALNMCPRWGLVRYDQHKRMPGEGRAMALELGSAAHDAFAAIRIFQLLEYGRNTYGNEVVPLTLRRSNHILERKGDSGSGAERMHDFLRFFNSEEDTRRRVISCAVSVINSSGFYDDPSDKRRTLSNLENSIVAYIDRMDISQRIPYVNIETGFVGIEVPINIVIEFPMYQTRDVEPLRIRYIGKMDALVNGDRGPEVEENKTASRLGQDWQDSFTLNHQPTGYCVAASCITGESVTEAMIRGMMVPLPKSYDLGGIVNLPIERDSYRVNEWLRWIFTTVTTQWLPYKDDPLNAPEFTHSCNRYFRSCSFIPLCAMAEPEERELTFSQMVHDEWNPLEGESGGGD